jgi:hypothetical protein
MPTPAKPEPATIADLLAQLPEPGPKQTAATYIAQLATTGHQAQVQANAYRIKLGLALLAAKPVARKGVSEWEAASAERLGIEVRQLRTYCATAKTVSTTAATMPVAVLDRALNKVVVEAKRLQAGLPSDKPQRKPRDPRQDAVHAVVRLLMQVAPEQQVAWLGQFTVDVELAQAAAYGQNAPMD